MSEAMAIEKLTASFLAHRLETAFHGARYPVYTGGRTNQTTDLDSWAAAPRAGRLALAECKAQGGVHDVWVIEPGGRLLGGYYAAEAANMVTALFAERNSWVSAYFGFSVRGEDAWKGLRKLEIWLVGNIAIPGGEFDALDAQFTDELCCEFEQPCTEFGVEITGFVRPTLDVIAETIEQVDAAVEEGWSRRYGDDQLDLFRELARYRQAKARDGGQGASGRTREWARERLRKACKAED